MSVIVWTDGGVDGDWTNDANWEINIRNASYQWTASASGTNEYYLQLAGGGNPNLSQPDNVAENGSNMASGTAGSLTAGQWDWADNDALGFSTVYVRLSTGNDPDDEVNGYVTASRAPVAGDDVYIESSNRAIETNIGQASVAVASLNVAQNFNGTAGTENRYLEIGATDVHIGYTLGSTGSPAGSTRLNIDLGSTTNATVRVDNSASSSTDTGFEPIRLLMNNSSNNVYVRQGRVSIGSGAGETLDMGELNVSNELGEAQVSVGYRGGAANASVSTLETDGGNVTAFASITTADIRGGTATLGGDQAITTIEVRGGTAILNTTGTITTLNMRGGTTDFSQSNESRTVTTATIYSGATLENNPDAMTFTNELAFGDTSKVTVSVN